MQISCNKTKRLRNMNGSIPAGLSFRLYQHGRRFLGLVHHCNHRYVRPIYEFTMLMREINWHTPISLHWAEAGFAS